MATAILPQQTTVRVGPGLSHRRGLVAPLLDNGYHLAQVESAVSSVAYDLREKLAVYQRHGIPEYLVWQIEERRIDWFTSSGGEYVRRQASRAGRLCSAVFPGLWLHPEAMLAGDLKTVLRHLHKGLSSPDHRQFVRRLRAT